MYMPSVMCVCVANDIVVYIVRRRCIAVVCRVVVDVGIVCVMIVLMVLVLLMLMIFMLLLMLAVSRLFVVCDVALCLVLTLVPWLCYWSSCCNMYTVSIVLYGLCFVLLVLARVVIHIKAVAVRVTVVDSVATMYPCSYGVHAGVTCVVVSIGNGNVGIVVTDVAVVLFVCVYRLAWHCHMWCSCC